jgi:cholesterol transport system auxiliary component
MSPLRTALCCALALLLSACASAPGIPETTYYRLPPLTPVEAHAEPLSPLPIAVDTFSADGLYSDQALIYALDADANRLRSYHYQMWIDPPGYLLQRRLIDYLRAQNLARLVTDSLPSQLESLRVRGRILRLERVPNGGDGWRVGVSLLLRADIRDGGPPLIVRRYATEEAASGPLMGDSVRAMGTAIDRMYADFARDLGAALAGRER